MFCLYSISGIVSPIPIRTIPNGIIIELFGFSYISRNTIYTEFPKQTNRKFLKSFKRVNDMKKEGLVCLKDYTSVLGIIKYWQIDASTTITC